MQSYLISFLPETYGTVDNGAWILKVRTCWWGLFSTTKRVRIVIPAGQDRTPYFNRWRELCQKQRPLTSENQLRVTTNL